VVMFYGIRTGARQYEIHFGLFADRIVLQRSRRTEDMADWIIRYARRLETYCRIYPFNWFNFYDFWDHGPHAASPSQVRTAAVADAITGVGTPRGGGTIATTAGCRDR
jgi:hypothetical protein